MQIHKSIQELKSRIEQACRTAEEFTKLYYECIDKKRHVSGSLNLKKDYFSASSSKWLDCIWTMELWCGTGTAQLGRKTLRSTSWSFHQPNMSSQPSIPSR